MRHRVTPLADLIKAADEMIVGGPAKQASANVDPFVEKLASALEEATEPVSIGGSSSPDLVEFEKIAEAVNVLDAAAEIESAKGIESFCEKARSEGYSEEEIGSAVQKIAAANLKKSMPLLVALGLGVENKLEPKALGERLLAYSRQQALSNAKTQGY